MNIMKIRSASLIFLLGSIAFSANASQSWSYTYNDLGLVTSEDGPRTDLADITTYTYDEFGNLLTATNAVGHTVTYNEYSPSGLSLSVTDANGVTTELSYNYRGEVTQSIVRHPSGDPSLDIVTFYEYDPVGQLIGMTLPGGATISMDYDAARRLVAIENSQGERIEYTLDAAGNHIQEVIKDSSGTIRYSVNRAYDELSRVMDVMGNNQQHDHLDYDVNDNTTAVTDGRSHTTEKLYDALNRVKRVVDPAQGSTDYTYNDQNQITSVTDPKGLITHYRYDGLGNLVEIISPDTGTTTYDYDAAGNRISSLDSRGVSVNYRYDALNRLVEILYPDYLGQNTLYHYDDTSGGNPGIGRLTSISDASGSSYYRYNALGHVIEKQATTAGTSLTLQYQYGAQGQLVGITYPSGRQVHYERDGQGRLTRALTQADLQAPNETLMDAAQYLPYGPVTEWDYGNGLKATHQYDQDYRLTEMSVGSSNPLLARLYQYDAVNNITSIDNTVTSAQSESFSYDPLNRLTDALSLGRLLSYGYDPVGNRIESYEDGNIENYLYGANSHRLQERDNTQYQYDAVGNIINNGSFTFQYSASNRLSSVEDSNGFVAEYRHNALGQRVYKRTAGANGTPPSNHVTVYLYNETGQLLGEYNETGAAIREYIYRDTVPLALATNNQIYYYHNDHLATPKLLTDTNQNIVWQAKHTPFGKADIQVQQVTNNLRFPGQHFDEETGLHYNYFRDYDPEIGRYLQSDPIGLEGGLNTYAYVHNNPLKYTDPEGLAAQVCVLPGVNAVCAAAVGKALNAAVAVGVAAYELCRNDNGDECNKLNQKVQDAKNEVGRLGACRAGMSQYDLRVREQAWLDLATARAKRDKKCWNGGDAGHQQAQADAWRHVGQCQALMQ